MSVPPQGIAETNAYRALSPVPGSNVISVSADSWEGSSYVHITKSISVAQFLSRKLRVKFVSRKGESHSLEPD